MKICILGATGLVGKELLELIPQAWPGSQLDLYASRARREVIGGIEHEIRAAEALEASEARGGDVAFVALDDAYSARYVPRLLDLGYRVVDKSNTYRMDPKVPLVVAGVNSDQVDDATCLVANPNCTTIPFTLAVAPLDRAFGLERAAVSSYQAISGAGIGALDDFLEIARDTYAASLMSGDRLGMGFDPSGYAGNTVPHNGKTDESGFSSEERKLMFESRKILSLPNLRISAQCCRVPVAVGHYENAWIGLRENVDLTRVADVYGNGVAPFTRFFPGAAGEELSARRCLEHRDEALIGRLRTDPAVDEAGFCLTVAADNLRLGAATNAIRVATCWFPSEAAFLQA